MKEIPLTKGYVALVDDEDYEQVSQHKWCVKETHAGPYAKRGKKEAGMAYDAKARELFGDFACCNFPLPEEVV